MKPVMFKQKSDPVPEAMPKPNISKAFDALLEPLSQPTVTESNSDTALGLWQDSVLLQDEPADSQFHHSTFKETEPMGLFDDLDLTAVKKPPNRSV